MPSTRSPRPRRSLSVGPHRVWQLEDAIFLAYATGRYADGRSLMEAALSASPEPDRDAILWWSLLKAIGGEADHADAARRRRRAVEAEEAVAAGRRFADVLRRSAQRAIDADGGGPMIRAELRTADAEESSPRGPAGSRTLGRRRRGAERARAAMGAGLCAVPPCRGDPRERGARRRRSGPVARCA